MSQERIIGNVNWFDSKKGYGFVKVLTPDLDNTGNDIFLHFTSMPLDLANLLKIIAPYLFPNMFLDVANMLI